MLYEKLKESGFDFNKVSPDIARGIELLEKSKNYEASSKLDVLDNKVFEALKAAYPDDPAIIKINLEREAEASKIDNDGFNTMLNTQSVEDQNKKENDLIEQYSKNLPPPKRGGKYSKAEWSEIRDYFNERELEKEVFADKKKEILLWRNDIVGLIGLKQFKKYFLVREFPYNSLEELDGNKHNFHRSNYPAWALNGYISMANMSAKGIFCTHGDCFYDNIQNRTFKNVQNSLRITLSTIFNNINKYLQILSNPELYDGGLPLADWSRKFKNEGIPTALKAQILRNVYDLSIDNDSHYDEAIDNYLKNSPKKDKPGQQEADKENLTLNPPEVKVFIETQTEVKAEQNLIDKFLKTIPYPYNGKTYLKDQWEIVKSLFEFKNLEKDVLSPKLNEIKIWKQYIINLLGEAKFKKYFVEERFHGKSIKELGDDPAYFLINPYPYGILKDAIYSAFAHEKGILCKYGNCFFEDESNRTIENVIKSAKASFTKALKDFNGTLQLLHGNELYHAILPVKDWSKKYGRSELDFRLLGKILNDEYKIPVYEDDTYEYALNRYLKVNYVPVKDWNKTEELSPIPYNRINDIFPYRNEVIRESEVEYRDFIKFLIALPPTEDVRLILEKTFTKATSLVRQSIIRDFFLENQGVIQRKLISLYSRPFYAFYLLTDEGNKKFPDLVKFQHVQIAYHLRKLLKEGLLEPQHISEAFTKYLNPVDEEKSGGIRPGFMSSPMLMGKEIEISMPNGERRKGQFAIVELDEIIASHNEKTFSPSHNYPVNSSGENINDRNYKDDPNAQSKVIEMAEHLEPSILISTSRTPAGTPIITRDGIVVSGNNRTMSLKLALQEFPENYDSYKKFLLGEIAAFGVDDNMFTGILSGDKIFDERKRPKLFYERRPGDYIKIKNPVLIRFDYDFPAYTTTELSKYNKDTKKSERPIDKAIKLSNILHESTGCKNAIATIIGEYETLSDFYNNVRDQKQVMNNLEGCNILTSQERASYYTESGFNSAGKDLIEALLGSIILDKEALMASEMTGVKRLRGIVITSLPVLVKNANLKEGNLITEINQALILEKKIYASGLSFNDYLIQGNLFEAKPDRRVFIINRLLNSGRNNFKKSLEHYNASVASNQEASLFGEKPTTEEIFKVHTQNKIDPKDLAAIDSITTHKKTFPDKANNPHGIEINDFVAYHDTSTNSPKKGFVIGLNEKQQEATIYIGNQSESKPIKNLVLTHKHKDFKKLYGYDFTDLERLYAHGLLGGDDKRLLSLKLYLPHQAGSGSGRSAMSTTGDAFKKEFEEKYHARWSKDGNYYLINTPITDQIITELKLICKLEEKTEQDCILLNSIIYEKDYFDKHNISALDAEKEIKLQIIWAWVGKDSQSNIEGVKYIMAYGPTLTPLQDLTEGEINTKFENAKNWANGFIEKVNFDYAHFKDLSYYKSERTKFEKVSKLLEKIGQYTPTESTLKIEEYTIIPDLYHGTCRKFDRFESNEPVANTGDLLAYLGFHFTPNKELAERIITTTANEEEKKNCKVFKVNLKVFKTLVIKESELVVKILKHGFEQNYFNEGKNYRLSAGELEIAVTLPYFCPEYCLNTMLVKWKDNFDFRKIADSYLKKVLIPQGYDSIKYLNEIEFKEKKRYDWIVFGEKQILDAVILPANNTPFFADHNSDLFLNEVRKFKTFLEFKKKYSSLNDWIDASDKARLGIIKVEETNWYPTIEYVDYAKDPSKFPAFQKLIDYVENDGGIPPVIGEPTVFKDGKNGYSIRDGVHRLSAYEIAAIKYIPVLLYDRPDENLTRDYDNPKGLTIEQFLNIDLKDLYYKSFENKPVVKSAIQPEATKLKTYEEIFEVALNEILENKSIVEAFKCDDNKDQVKQKLFFKIKGEILDNLIETFAPDHISNEIQRQDLETLALVMDTPAGYEGRLFIKALEALSKKCKPEPEIKPQLEEPDTREGNYYVDLVKNGKKTVLLLGPFVNDHRAALKMVDAVKEKAIQIDANNQFWSFGTIRMEKDYTRSGTMNEIMNFKNEDMEKVKKIKIAKEEALAQEQRIRIIKITTSKNKNEVHLDMKGRVVPDLIVVRDFDTIKNVLVPKGLREIFETQDLEAAYEIMDSDDYDDLKALIKEDLPTLSAIQMFELIQLHHPTEYGLRIKREDLLIEWRKRGKKIFEELGLPTDNDYPYVNLKLGYFNVCKLKTVLDYELPRFNWWQVAEHFRPIADLNKGIQILDELIGGLKKDKEKLVDKKTGRVLEKRGAARKLKSIEFDLERLEWSKSIVLNYLSEQKKGH